MQNRVAGNIPHVVDFAYVEALVFGTNCLKSSEMEASKAPLGFELTSVEENFELVGLDFSETLKPGCVPFSPNLLLYLTFFAPFLLQPHLFQWCNSLHLLVTSHLQALQRRGERGI